MSDQLEVRVARIESDVEHIKRHTADISVELRRTNDRIDVTNEQQGCWRPTRELRSEVEHERPCKSAW